MKKGLVVIVILVLAGAGFGAYMLMNKSDDTDSTTDTTTSDQATATDDTTTEQTPADSTDSGDSTGDNTITYSNSGFSPASLTVKAGTTITVKNTSSRPLQFSSDPHPVHTDDTELNMSTISPGKTGTVTVKKKGTHGYHNHLKDEDTGTLIVN